MRVQNPSATPGQAVKPSSRFSAATAWLLTAGAFYAFFVFGFTDNLKGPTLPQMQAEINLSYSLAGTILLVARLGFLLAVLAMGFLGDRVGQKIVLLLAGAFMAAGALGYSTFQSFGALAAAMLVLGLGVGSVEIGANALMVEVQPEQRGKFLNLMATFFGLGSMIAPLLAGSLIQTDLSWRLAYRWALLPIGIMILVFLVVHYSRPRATVHTKPSVGGVIKSAFTRQRVWYYLVIGLYVATEVGIAAWMVKFLQGARGFSVIASAGYLSVFFALIMGGRFFGSFVVERAGYIRSALFAATGAAACISIGVFGPAWAAIFLALTGLFLSIIHPTVTAAVSTLNPENTGSALGLLFAFGGLGGMLGPQLVGLASDWLGISQGIGVTLLTCLLMIACLAVVLPKKR